MLGVTVRASDQRDSHGLCIAGERYREMHQNAFRAFRIGHFRTLPSLRGSRRQLEARPVMGASAASYQLQAAFFLQGAHRAWTLE